MTEPRPVILAVDDDPGALGKIEDQLRRSYERDYSVVCESVCSSALERLRQLREAGTPVALVLADQRSNGLTGADLLGRARDLHPHARRALLIDWDHAGPRGLPGREHVPLPARPDRGDREHRAAPAH